MQPGKPRSIPINSAEWLRGASPPPPQFLSAQLGRSVGEDTSKSKSTKTREITGRLPTTGVQRTAMIFALLVSRCHNRRIVDGKEGGCRTQEASVSSPLNPLACLVSLPNYMPL